MIWLKNVSKRYVGDEFDVLALNHINLEIQAGEFVAITGASGSGKSTLLNLIGCMDSASEGELYIDSLPLHQANTGKLDQIRKQYISFVFQHFALLPEFTVYENVEIPLLARSYQRKERRERIREALKRLGIEKYEKKFPDQLSGGQQQRVAIARALVADSPIILADEPTGAIDTKNTEQLMEFLSEINKNGKTVIVVTHSDFVADYAKRVIQLNDGLIIRDSGKEEKSYEKNNQ